MESNNTNSKILLDIVIINWNSLPQLSNCLRSISTCSQLSKISITIVDNSIPPEKIKAISKVPSFSLLQPQKNLGFGSGCNYGASQGKAAFILFLNPDITFPPGSLNQILESIRKNELPPEASIIGVRLLNPDGSTQKAIARFPHFKQLFPRMLGLDRIFPSVFKQHYCTELDYTQNQYVDQVPGAFFLVRREVFEQLDGFDEQFFMYYEDVDFAYRVYLSDWKTFYYAEIAVEHQGGGTTQGIKAKRMAYSMHSRVLYAAKHFGKIRAILLYIGILFLEFPVRIIRAALCLKIKDLLYILEALCLFLSGTFGMLGENEP